MKLLIIGGVAGGASAAARARRLAEDAEIIIFEKGGYISFANCGLPYHIGGVIKKRDDLLLQSPQSFKARFNVEVRVFNEVTKIDRAAKEIEVKNIQNGNTYREKYDKLILAPGAGPARPPLPGIDLEGIFTLRTIPDTDNIISAIEKKKAKNAVVVGGGFIGLEMAENLKSRGLNVTIVEMLDQVMPPMDKEMAQIIHQHLKVNGINLILGDGVAGFEKAKNKIKVTLKSGNSIEAEVVILSIGVLPDTKLASEAGLDIGKSRGIKVNEFLQTTDSDIFAVGDAIEVVDLILGTGVVAPLGGPANKQGRITADNIFSRKSHYCATAKTAICKVFDLTAAVTGVNEKNLKEAGRKYQKIYIHPFDHASYYPGAAQMTIKLLFDEDNGKILGAQIVGAAGVDKRIDVLSTAIKAKMTVYDLEGLELSYAPPYGSAKDPVNHLGFTASNVLKGDLKIISPDEIRNIENRLILDVRTKREFGLGHIDGAVHIPVDEIRKRIDEIPKDKTVITYCQVGIRSYIAYRILSQKGFNCYNISGGYKTYRQYYPDSL